MNTSSQELLVIDFDRTVFDSDALYRDLYKLCEVHGINRNSLDPSLALVPPDNLLFNFFLMIRRSQVIEPSRIERVVTEIQSHIREKGQLYVFNDSRPFLYSAIRSGWKVIILTYGDQSFQFAKFVGSKLSDLCHSFIVTSDVKWNQLEISGITPTIFLDDNPKNIDEVKTKFPEMTVVEIKRPNTKYQNVLSMKADLVVNRLDWPLKLCETG